MKFLLLSFGSAFSVLGVLYMKSSEVLWGLFQVVIGLVYFFGFEKYGQDEDRHVAAHLIVGGMMGGVSAVFLALEKILSLLSEPSPVTPLDIVLFVLGGVAIIGTFQGLKRFG